MTPDNPRYVTLSDALVSVESMLMNALVAWYHDSPATCAHWCDDMGDRSGALLGRVRDEARAEREKQRAES